MHPNIEETDPEGMYKIHNVRFYNLTPRSINYLAYNSCNGRLAVSRLVIYTFTPIFGIFHVLILFHINTIRTDASIEIWNMLYAGYLESSILGQPQSSVEAMGWAGERLFSTGHTGELTEWNLRTLQVEDSLMLTGNSAWCMAVNRKKDQIAVGTEEGYLNIFKVDDYGLTYEKICDKQEGRILCCCYDRSGRVLVTGSIDCIRIWDVYTGHAIHRMATGRAESHRETIVWSLSVLSDLTIIAGDSRGRITIWDGHSGTQSESFPALRGDVLSVAVNEEETVFSCSGIDPIIKMYVRTAVRRENQQKHAWIKYIQRSVHDHDIKALAFGSAGQVYSGGIDGYLGVSVSAKSKQMLLKYGPFMPQPCAVVAEEKRLLLLKYFNYLELWQLGSPTNSVELCDEEDSNSNTEKLSSNKYLSLERGLVKIVELRAFEDKPVVCASLSPDGQWLAYSTETAVRLFRLTIDGGISRLQRIHDGLKKMCAGLHLLFGQSSKMFYVVKRTGIVEVFQLNAEDNEIVHRSSVDTSKVINGCISSLNVSNCGRYMVIVGTCCTIAVFKTDLSDECEWKHHSNLPKYCLAPTAVSLHANLPVLVAAFSDSKVSYTTLSYFFYINIGICLLFSDF